MLGALPYDLVFDLFELLHIKDVFVLQGLNSECRDVLRHPCGRAIVVRLLGMGRRGEHAALCPDLQWQEFIKMMRLHKDVLASLSFHHWKNATLTGHEEIDFADALSGNASCARCELIEPSRGGVTISGSGVQCVSGQFGAAARFHGQSRVEIQGMTRDPSRSDAPFALSYWIYIEQQEGAKACHSMISLDQVNPESQRGTYYMAHGLASMWTGVLGNYREATTLPAGRWHHVVISYAHNAVAHYINGELIPSEPPKSAVVSQSCNRTLRISPRKCNTTRRIHHGNKVIRVPPPDPAPPTQLSTGQWSARVGCSAPNVAFILEELSFIDCCVDPCDVPLLALGVAFKKPLYL